MCCYHVCSKDEAQPTDAAGHLGAYKPPKIAQADFGVSAHGQLAEALVVYCGIVEVDPEFPTMTKSSGPNFPCPWVTFCCEGWLGSCSVVLGVSACLRCRWNTQVITSPCRTPLQQTSHILCAICCACVLSWTLDIDMFHDLTVR